MPDIKQIVLLDESQLSDGRTLVRSLLRHRCYRLLASPLPARLREELTGSGIRFDDPSGDGEALVTRLDAGVTAIVVPYAGIVARDEFIAAATRAGVPLLEL